MSVLLKCSGIHSKCYFVVIFLLDDTCLFEAQSDKKIYYFGRWLSYPTFPMHLQEIKSFDAHICDTNA